MRQQHRQLGGGSVARRLVGLEGAEGAALSALGAEVQEQQVRADPVL
ncbi:hypothetical protein KF840_13420 [bacterium]|nr:hypothetical protein [bacterium]